MWEVVARAAAEDSGAARGQDLLGDLQALTVIFNQGWQYDDPPARLAARLGAAPARAEYTGIGGSVPLTSLGALAGAVAEGQLDLALLVGAEALATVRQLKKAGEKPPWSFKPAERRPYPFDIPFSPAEVANQIFEAYLTFALFDTARRAHLGRTPAEHQPLLGQLMAPLTEVAAANPAHAWFPVARSPEEIATPGTDNRLVASPYTKLLTSIMDVDMAAAVLLASEAQADALGVPVERRVYLRSWASALDPNWVGQRRELWRSPAMKAASGAALAGAGVGIDDVALLDFYSCFASSVGFALDALGIDEAEARAGGGRTVTVTGGLPYHGGPGSNYVTHSLAAMTERLRGEPDRLGLLSGVGMHMTKHAYGVLSGRPGAAPGRAADPDALAAAVAADLEVAPITERPEGSATVATASVLYDRDNAPTWAALVLDLPDGSRAYARLEDPGDLAEADRSDLVGRTVQVATDEGGASRARL
jgi:acetyl-CoA C-acetyltransferase